MKLKYSSDPPKWRVIVGFVLIVISDLYSSIQALEEGMSQFQLIKAVLLIAVHALIIGLIFLQKEEEKKEENP